VTTCPECGAAVTPDVDFCPQCDAYLAWETPGGRPAGRPPATPAPRPAPDPVPSAPDPVGAPATPVAAPGAPAAEYDHDPPVVSIPVITIPPWPFAGDDTTTATVGAGGPGPGRTPVAPSGRGDPVAVLPGRPSPKAPAAGLSTSPTPSAAKDGTGIQCTTCGSWNTAGLHFCTSCGAEIVAAPPPTTTAPPRRSTSGFRKRSRVGRVVVVLVVAAVVLALALTGYLLRDPLQSFAASALDRVAGVGAVNPSKVTASGSAPGHPANAAHDGASNIAWEAAAPGPATGESLTFAFDRPFRLVVVQVLPGAATDQPTFLKSRRPTQVRFAIERTGQPTVQRTLRLVDQPGPQRFDLGIEQVRAVRMTVLQSSGPPGARVAIAEVEFSGR
jgi:hypothetical protein